MKRYTTRSSDFPWWSPPFLPHLTVFEPEPEPRPTGLVDHHGNEIVAIEERDPIGFVWPRR